MLHVVLSYIIVWSVEPPHLPHTRPSQGSELALRFRSPFVMSSSQDAAQACINMLLQTPPGQKNQVLQNIKGILTGIVSPDQVEGQARPILLQYAHEQLLPVSLKMDGKSDNAIVCEAAKLDDKYYHPRLSCTFVYDPFLESAVQVTSIPRPTSEAETLRAAVDEELSKYMYRHYHTGVCSTFLPASCLPMRQAASEPLSTQDTDANEPEQTSTSSVPEVTSEHAQEPKHEESTTDSSGQESQAEVLSGEQTKHAPSTIAHELASPLALTIHIVGNKYKLRNYWSGRWRSTYVFDLSTRAFTQSDIRVQTHYFENGNVQMQTQYSDAMPVFKSTDSLAADVIRAIEAHEQNYQTKLFETTDLLREDAFKALRRTLPITREKVDWEKAVSYKIGAELAK